MFIPVWVFGVIAGLMLVVGLVLLFAFIVGTRNARMFRAVAEGASDGLVLMEQDSRIVWVNNAYCKIMGYPRQELIGRYPLSFALPPEDALSEEEINSFRFDPEEERFGKLTQVRNVRKNGERFMHEFSHAVVSAGFRMRFLLASRDITERIERETALIAAHERLESLSRRDSLTGLFNRAYLRQSLEDLLKGEQSFAVLQIDMNDFKALNDTYGHHAGDAMLRHLAELLSDMARDDWVLARIGGDEFTLLLPGVGDLSEALKEARRLFLGAQVPLPWNAGELISSISLGVAIADDQAVGTDEILNRADVALYNAKAKRGERVSGYDAATHAAYVERQGMQHEIRQAVEAREIQFHLQPVVDLRTKRICRFEMLARWQHPRLGLLGPGQFLPMVEQMGLIETLDRHVVETGLATIKRFDEAGLLDTGLSINLSASAMRNATIPEFLIWQADALAIDPGRLSVEILETTAVALTQNDAVATEMRRLADAGFRLLLDDFGMGYAGLAHLAMASVHGVKIDRQLTSHSEHDPGTLCVVAAIIDLAAQLNVEVIVEGVETEGQIEGIRGVGGNIFQGYAVARPMSCEAALDWARNVWPEWSLQETGARARHHG